MINLNQIRAKHAFENVAKISNAKKEQNEKFLSLARGLPTMLQQNGLLATWAFFLAKKEDHHQAAAKIILDHLKAYFPQDGHLQNKDFKTFFTEYLAGHLINTNGQLMKMTSEAIVFSGWIKRAAEALCEEG